MARPDDATSDLPLTDAFAGPLADILGRLDGVVPGLGQRAIAFVLTGNPETVRLELDTHQGAAEKALEEQDSALSHFGGGLGNGILAGNAGATGTADGAPVPRAADRIAWAFDSAPPDVLRRYAEVMLAIHPRAWGINDPARSQTLWLRWLTQTARSATRSGDGFDQPPAPDGRAAWTVARMDACLLATGHSPATIVEELFAVTSYSWGSIVGALDDLGPWLAANVERVVAASAWLDAAARTRLIAEITRFNLAGPYRGLLFGEAIGSAKGPAKAARAALHATGLADLEPLAVPVFAAKDAAARRGVAEVLALIGGPAAIPILEARHAVEPSAPVRDAIAVLLRQMAAIATGAEPAGPEVEAPPGATVLTAIDGGRIVIPPVPPPPPDTPLDAAMLAPLDDIAAAFNATVVAANRQGEAQHKAHGWSWSFTPSATVVEGDIAKLCAVMNGREQQLPSVMRSLLGVYDAPQVAARTHALTAVFERPEVTLWHLLRLVAVGIGRWRTLRDVVEHPNTVPERQFARILTAEQLDYRTVLDMLAAIGCGDSGRRDHLLRRMIANGEDGQDLPDSLRFYVLEHLEVFEEALGVRPQQPSDRAMGEAAALRLLGALDRVPERLLPPLLAVALAGKRSVRGAARSLIASARGIDDAILARLADPKAEIRASAADWLAARRTQAAVGPLHAALEREKSELPRAAMLSALVQIGEDISAYFDERFLRRDAEAGLAKANPRSLDWFPFAAMPILRWAGGKPVPAEVVRWWVVLADRLKNPAGNAMFDLYLDRCEPADAEAFGRFLLTTFIDRDTATCSEAEAIAHAEQARAQHIAWTAQMAVHNPNFQSWTTPEQAFRTAKASKLNTPLHSCADNKGLLGLAVRAPGAEAASLTRDYVKAHGHKVSQTKALLASLARNPSPTAIQVVFAAANRVRQRTVQAYAAELIADVAERRGWTAEELADRTIPSAGFDEAGEMSLDCGEERLFTARYRGAGVIDLVNPAGKPVKSLPAARNDDEKERVGAARKQLADARKEVKQTETAQRDRLYEAMCVGRRWSREVWTSCVRSHPIVGRLAQNLVWDGLDDDGARIVTFRPLADGTLSDADDEPVDLATVAFVRLTHRALLDAAAAATWTTHLADYEVNPLFPQLDRPVHALDPAHRDATAITDREGHMIEALKLKGVALRAGYEPGAVGDGGSYTDYVKRFSGAGLAARIGFTGSYMGAGAETIPAALTSLTFVRLGRAERAVKLADVPPVLLSEAIADLHAIAAAGTGYAADWKTRAAF